jgi:hypothetical protein
MAVMAVLACILPRIPFDPSHWPKEKFLVKMSSCLDRLLLVILLLGALGGAACGESESSSSAGAGGSTGMAGAAGSSGAGGRAGTGGDASSGGTGGCPVLGCDPNCGDAGVALDENGCVTCSCSPRPDAAIDATGAVDATNTDAHTCECPDWSTYQTASGPCACPGFSCSHLYCPLGDLHVLRCDNGRWLTLVQYDTYCAPVDAAGEN